MANQYKAPEGPPPGYPQPTYQNYDSGPVDRYPGSPPPQNQFYGPMGPGYQQQGPYQQSPYGYGAPYQQQPMYYQQQPPMGYYQDRGGPGAGGGICAGLLGALACCCCLDMLF